LKAVRAENTNLSIRQAALGFNMNYCALVVIAKKF